jgi:hypothetical protein
MISRDWLFIVARSDGLVGDQWNTQKGRAERVM